MADNNKIAPTELSTAELEKVAGGGTSTRKTKSSESASLLGHELTHIKQQPTFGISSNKK